MNKQIWVSPNNDSDWKVKNIENSKASKVFDNKIEACKYATELAKKANAELIVQKKDGQIQQKNSFGNDPKNIKG